MKSICFTSLVVMIFVNITLAGLRELPYCGQLYNGATLVGGTSGQNQQFYFRIYSAQTGGSLLWQSGSTVTQFIKNGLLSINLGNTNVMSALTESVFNNSNTLWLEVQTAPLGSALVTLSPRKKITTSAYGFDANRLGGINASAYMRKWTNVILVAPGGASAGADFASINNAVTDASGKATPLNRYTVFVLPGTYVEAINSSPNVDIIGIDRDNCMINGTLTIAHSILVENLTFDNNASGGTAISITGGNPTINNVKAIGGLEGVNIQLGAINATIHNFESENQNIAIRDDIGVKIDGLRSDGQAFEVNAALSSEFVYRNIIQTQSGAPMVGNILGGSGSIRSIKGLNTLNISTCSSVDIRDARVTSSFGAALNIQNVDMFGSLKIFDSVFSTTADPAVIIGSFDNPALIEGSISFDDVKFFSDGSDGISAFFVTNITVEDCEIKAGNNGINCQKNISDNAVAQLYIQTSKIYAYAVGINLAGATELWIYDTAIKCPPGNFSIVGNTVAPGITPLPRIADCKFGGDTNPSQNSGAPGWNALMPPGGSGNVGGFGEDSAGNIVMPLAGTPIFP